MPYLELNCRATIIGSLPHTDAGAACRVVTHYLKDVPVWPQLPNRSFLENMYAQYSEGFPCIKIENDRIYVDRSQDLNGPLQELYQAYLENNIDRFPISPEYAAGLYAFLALPDLLPVAVKGQVTGPVSWGLTVTDNEKRSIIYDDTLADAAAKLLRLKAAWQERELRRVSRKTIIFVDEPYMASYGSAFVSLSREKVITLLNEVFGGITGLKGVHCCGNTDWSVLLGTRADILSFDAYNYAESLSLFQDEVKRFLGRGGTIAWGIVPNQAEAVARETVASLKDRLEEAMSPFTRNGVRFRELFEQSLLTPSCGLPGLSEEAAEQVLQLLAALSDRMRERYG